jgi:ABC-type iron transport system FetAB ATPase subunit
MPRLLEVGPMSARNGEGRFLFRGATVRLEEGRATVLDGPSGSGKSTLLRQIAGLTESDGPVVRRLGTEEFSGPAIPRWRADVTLLAQDAPMLPGTVWDNLSFPFAFKNRGDRAIRRAGAKTALDRVGLAQLALEREVSTLSGGERHRLALLRGLLWDPPVLLADEPLSGLDTESADRCLELLLEFARRPGHGLLAVLHDGTQSHRTDAAIRLRDGRLEAA